MKLNSSINSKTFATKEKLQLTCLPFLNWKILAS